MPAENFVDSNIFVYMFDRSEPSKRQRARDLVYGLLDDETGCISYQVVQESLNALTGKLSRRMCVRTGKVLVPMWQVNPTAGPRRTVQRRFGFSFYDSLIVAAALQTGSPLQRGYGQQIQGLTIPRKPAQGEGRVSPASVPLPEDGLGRRVQSARGNPENGNRQQQAIHM